MQVRTATDEAHEIALVELSGALNPHSAAAARRVLAAAADTEPRLVVDLRRLTDVDPALALALLETADGLARDGGWLCLVHGRGRAGSSLRFMGVHDRIRSSPTLVSSGWGGQPTKRLRQHVVDPATCRTSA
jgi:anti-anti-sigma regulatory factor